MPTYSTTDIIKTFKEKEISLFTLSDFAKLFNLDNQQTLYKKIARLEQKRIVRQLIKGKYQFLLTSVNNFAIANFIYSPSYISLESALSFHSIITGFPHLLTSVTPKPTKAITIGDQEIHYSHFAPRLFWGYEKKENFLLAEPEKALLDYAYFATKGLRNPTFDEMELNSLNPTKLAEYTHKFHNQLLSKLIHRLI